MLTPDRPPHPIHGSTLFGAAAAPVDANSHLLEGSYHPHRHDFWEMVVIAAGTGLHASAAGHQPLAAGDALLLRPGSWHAYLACRGLHVWNCCFGADLVRRQLAWTASDAGLGGLLGEESTDPTGVLSLRLSPESLRECLGELATLERLPSAPAADLVARLLLLLSRLSMARGDGEGGKAEQPAGRHPAVVKGVAVLAADLAHPWTLAELARRLDLDRSYLVRLFRRDTGLPPMAYLARERAQRAAELVLATGRQLAAIGTEVGWDDPNYFARRFRRHLGMSASDYRARFSGEVARTDGTHGASAGRRRP
ncbi:MAG TPA: AraC family transcriptional regulator [Candidatus Dormibacteraeota bacterium]|jgi:AraC family L-rhamnose operon transcriptional activator RhaR|nr:AraC family transcriptional regulator [Candidatus Dormibacteraeota bacterium]